MADSPTPFEAFELAVQRAKGQSSFARMVGCTPGNISQLLKKRSPLPSRFALKAEAGTGVPKEWLCPDVFLPESAPAHAARASDMEPAR